MTKAEKNLYWRPSKMFFLVGSISFFVGGFLFSLLCRRAGAKKSMALGGVVAGSLSGLVPAILVLAGQESLNASFAGTIPGLSFSVGLDPLSAFFLVPILGLSALTALYAWGYLQGQKRLFATLPFFPLLVASMMGVVIVQNGFWFLIVWEIMSLASFFLVTTEHEQREVRHAGWIYLAATHLATAFLLVFFTLLYQETGSFDFRDFSALRTGPLTGFLFLCALIGFGTKAGVFPFHIWLPHAHPAAPSYISALMSGVMIKTGIYGLLRALTFFQATPFWYAELLLVLGIASAILGVLYALMQHDIKKLLAYHSVENIGIIVTGIGLGLLGRGQQNTFVEVLGFGGALFHVVNHAIFKGLLFLGAGNVVRAVHTRRIDQLGGLLRKMPLTGITFLAASAAICALPPLNGFISEWLLYVGLFEGVKVFSQSSFFLCVAAVVGIAFAGGLAIACFTKVFGVVFLGNPRVNLEQPVQEGGWQQKLPMGILALLCLVLGLIPQLILPWLKRALLDLGLGAFSSEVEVPFATLGSLSLVFAILIGLFLLGLLIRYWLASSRTSRAGPTWDCGFDQPTPRMQYTASSYAEPLGAFFRFILKPLIHFRTAEGVFPQKTSFEQHVEDLSERAWFGPAVGKISGLLSWVRKRQRSQVQNYLAYIFVTLLLLLLWEVWIGI